MLFGGGLGVTIHMNIPLDTLISFAVFVLLIQWELDKGCVSYFKESRVSSLIEFALLCFGVEVRVRGLRKRLMDLLA